MEIAFSTLNVCEARITMDLWRVVIDTKVVVAIFVEDMLLLRAAGIIDDRVVGFNYFVECVCVC